MSIFDKDIRFPIDHLYDECKDICRVIIPGNMMHYNSSREIMQRDIMFELKNIGLLAHRYWAGRNSSDINKISKVDVITGAYIRGIPTYVVIFYFVDETIINDFLFIDGKVQYDKPFAQFTVGINGIIDEHILQ